MPLQEQHFLSFSNDQDDQPRNSLCKKVINLYEMNFFSSLVILVSVAYSTVRILQRNNMFQYQCGSELLHYVYISLKISEPCKRVMKVEDLTEGSSKSSGSLRVSQPRKP